MYEFLQCMSSYIPQDEKLKFFRRIKPSTTIQALPLHHRIAWNDYFFIIIYTAISEKMMSQNK